MTQPGKKSLAISQFLPIGAAFFTFVLLCVFLYGFIFLLNIFPIKANISLSLRFSDIFVGIIIYLKTAIDFALFIGNLMTKNPGVNNRIAIEIGTQLGNGVGTLLILTIWYFFREIPLLLAIMIFTASIVLLAMAEEGARELLDLSVNHFILRIARVMIVILEKVNKLFLPITQYILPKAGASTMKKSTFFSLAVFSFTVPFILGLDDFAGYIPLFSLVNVLGFSIGVFFAHMLLLTFLFISPKKTAAVVEYPAIILFGSSAFTGIAIFGFFEIGKMIAALL